MKPTNRRLREAVVEVLGLLSSSSAQHTYEQNVLVAHVPSELACMWFDDTYHPSSPDFQSAFSLSELEVLAAFNEVFESTLQEFGGSLPSLSELHSSASWGRLSSAATSAIAALAP
jgi:hypothetical protein